MEQCLGCAQVQGKSWSKLVQGRKCGQLIKSDEAIDKSPVQMCVNNSVRLALERPLWTPDITHMFPQRFKVQPSMQGQWHACTLSTLMPTARNSLKLHRQTAGH